MNLIRVSAHRADAPDLRATAHLMISDRQLFDLLDGAVSFLSRMGWVADDLTEFLVDLKPEYAQSDDQSHELWDQAEAHGIACLLEQTEAEPWIPEAEDVSVDALRG